MQFRSRYSANILRFAVAVAVVEYFAYKVLDPFYLQFMTTDRGLGLTPVKFGLFVSFASFMMILLEYVSGIFADKFGRRLSWAVSLFLYGGGMFWLSTVTSFRLALITAAFMGSSYAFVSGASEAWLFDHEGKEGMRKAYGMLYLVSVPLTLVGGLAAVALGYLFDSVRIPIALTGVIVVVNGLFILTFPENYGGRERKWLEIAKVGIRQFASSRVLQLTVLQTFFMTLAIWINSAWWVTYVVKEFNISIAGTAAAFAVVSVAAAVAGFYITKMKETDYRKLVIYPTVLMALFYMLMPFAPVVFMFVPLLIGVVASSYFRGTGITILENEIITEERATSLSFLSMVRGVFWVIGPLVWGVMIQIIDLKATFFMAGVFSAVSLVLLLWALRIWRRTHEQNINP